MCVASGTVLLTCAVIYPTQEGMKKKNEGTNLASPSLWILLQWRILASPTFARAPGSLGVKWRLLSELGGLSGLHSTPPCIDEETEICAFDVQPGAVFYLSRPTGPYFFSSTTTGLPQDTTAAVCSPYPTGEAKALGAFLHPDLCPFFQSPCFPRCHLQPS